MSGWGYLAAIIELHTRMIVGWSITAHTRTELVEQALENTLAFHTPTKRLMHHSDRSTSTGSNAA